MLQCQSTAMAGAALLRLRLVYRMLRVGELLALVAFVSWSSSYVPSAVAAALRLAGSLLLNARFVFVLGNAIVLLLFALSRHEHELSPSSSSSSGDGQSSSSTATTPPQAASAVAAADSAGFASFATPTTTTLPPADAMTTTTTSFATPPAPEPRAALEETKQQQPAVRVNKAHAPRRSRSEKMGPRPRRAASPELRRCESENGRRRRSSVTARDAEACWGREDADEFRRQVEAFIARQTRFHREESMLTMAARHCEPAPAFTGALAVVE